MGTGCVDANFFGLVLAAFFFGVAVGGAAMKLACTKKELFFFHDSTPLPRRESWNESDPYQWPGFTGEKK